VEYFIGNILSLLIEQKLDDIEVIVINDGSTDKTAGIAERYSQNNENIKFINFEKNKGVSVARNAGINAAKGKYIQFLDADDFIPNWTLDLYREFLPIRDNDIIVFGHEIKYKGKTKTIKNVKYNHIEFNKSDFLKLFFVRDIRCHLCSQVYLKSFLDDNSLRFIENMTKGQDIIFYRTAFFYARKIYCDSNVVFLYNIRPGSVSGEYKIYPKKELESFICDVDNIEKLSKSIPEILKYANFFLTERYIGNLIKYVRFADKDKKVIANALVDKKYLLFNNFVFRFPQTIVFWIFRLMPVKLIIKVF
jgi:glycosyltransferase involved in cell wall biosynthesis